MIFRWSRVWDPMSARPPDPNERTTTMRKTLILAAALAGTLLLAGCGKEINPQETNAGLVHGTDGLYRFCDGSTLIYFTDISGSDDIVEAVWPGLCVTAGDGSWTYDADAVTEAQRNGNGPDGER